MNHSNMIEVFDAVTGGIDGSASVDDWREMSEQDIQVTAEAMAENNYENLSAHELELVVNAIVEAQSAERDFDFREARSSLDEK